MQLRLDVVVAKLQSEGRAEGHAADGGAVGEPQIGARLGARVVLLDLRAVLHSVGLKVGLNGPGAAAPAAIPSLGNSWRFECSVYAVASTSQ